MAVEGTFAERDDSLNQLFYTWTIWLPRNKKALLFFTAALLSSIFLLCLTNGIRKLSLRSYRASSTLAKIARSQAALSRCADRMFSIGKLRFKAGSTIVIILYLGVNLILSLYDRPYAAGLTIIAKRFGWLALGNIVLAVFLGLKNTPLSPIAGKSFETLNVFHRTCGYTTIGFIVLHAILYAVGLAKVHLFPSFFQSPGQYAGATAGIAAVLIGLTANSIVRKRSYELFYTLHVFLVIVLIISAGLHTSQEYLAKQTKIPIIVAGSIWGLDKIFRFIRLAWSATGNYCTITPMPGEATKVTMHRSRKAAPGSSAFLWIPGLQPFQMHPFTITSNEPVEFLVKAQGGFTRLLYRAACKNPGSRWRAAMEGPYGKPPALSEYEKVILVAGGSGVTYTLPLAMEWLRQSRNTEKSQSLEFVLTAKTEESLNWFGAELSELITAPNVNVHLCVSGKSTPVATGSGNNSTSDVSLNGVSNNNLVKLSSEALKWRGSDDSSLNRLRQHGFTRGRPKIQGLIEAAIQGLTNTDRVLITACGPAELIDSTHRAGSGCASGNAPLIHVVTEQFSF